MKRCGDCGQDITFRQTTSGWRVACTCEDFRSFEPEQRASIIVPSRYPDLFNLCHESIDKYAPKENKILVRDSNLIEPPSNWTTIQGPEGFIYSRNINLGIQASTGDVLLTNDDVQLTHRRTLEAMQGVMAKYPDVGILSPLIVGAGAGEYWQCHTTKEIQYTDIRLCFVCVLIRREVIDKVGLLDERFDGYGGDDCDYCRRVVNAGYKLAVTARATVHHGLPGAQGAEWSTSYKRAHESQMPQLDKLANQRYFEKWGDYNLVGPFVGSYE